MLLKEDGGGGCCDGGGGGGGSGWALVRHAVEVVGSDGKIMFWLKKNGTRQPPIKAI